MLQPGANRIPIKWFFWNNSNKWFSQTDINHEMLMVSQHCSETQNHNDVNESVW